MKSAASSSDPIEVRIGRECGWLLLGVLIWLSRLVLPIPPAPPELDPSWQQGLSYALAHGFQFGREILFTFGPLGGIAHARYQPELYWLQILLFEFLFKGLLVWRWIAAMRRWPSALDRTVFVLMLVVSALGNDAFFFATMVVLASLQLDDPPPSRKRLVLDMLLLAVIAYIKFTYFLLASGVILMIVGRFSLRSRKAGLATLGIYVACLLVVWMGLGQAPWNLPIWIVRAASIASGYSEAQAYDGPLREVWLGVGWLGLLVLISTLTVIGSARRWERLFAALVVLGGAYVAFKASFTYHSAHGITFFGFAALSMCALRPPIDASAVRRVMLGFARAASIVVCLVGLSMTYGSSEEMFGMYFGQSTQGLRQTVEKLARLPELRGELEIERKRGAIEYDLPRIRAIVGNSEIDQLSATQAWIFHNNLNWKPRPVFQSYVTVAPNLLALNEDFYAGPDAPEFVLLELGAIDNRVCGMEDGGAWRSLLHAYAPVTVERNLVLLRRDPELAKRPPPETKIIAERDIRPLETVRLNPYQGKALRVRFDIRYNWLGKLRKLVYHAPITVIQLDMVGGGRLRGRLMPGMVKSGVLLRPYIEGNYDWVRLYTRGLDKRVAAFRILSLSEWDSLYEPQIHLVIERCDDVLPVPSVERELDLALGSFRTRPLLCNSYTEVRSFMADGRDVVLVGPSSRTVFELEAGKRRLTGACGMLKDSIGHSDGVDFAVVLVSKDGRRTLFDRRVDPKDESSLMLKLDVEFDARAGDRLALTTLNPPGRDHEYDLAYWEAIKIE